MSIQPYLDIVKIDNHFDFCAYQTILDYEIYGGEWNKYVENAYAELQEALYIGTRPEYVPVEIWTRWTYEWLFGADSQGNILYPEPDVQLIEALTDQNKQVILGETRQGE